jgi:hypothetical protein
MFFVAKIVVPDLEQRIGPLDERPAGEALCV